MLIKHFSNKKGENVMKSSVFVKIDRYNELSDVLRQISSKLEDAKEVLKKIKELKNQEDSELEDWHNELNTVEAKLADISQSIAEK
jgi:hypothetical protein